jgi:hypothetical protein
MTEMPIAKIVPRTTAGCKTIGFTSWKAGAAGGQSFIRRPPLRKAWPREVKKV